MTRPISTYHITGMDCADCARTLEEGVGQLDGVENSAVNFTTEILQVMGRASEAHVIERIRELGYDVKDPLESSRAMEDTAPESFLDFMLGRSNTRTALLAVLLILPGLIFHELLPGLGIHHWLIDLTSVIALLIAGRPIALSGWRAYRINRRLTINALMSIAAAGAVVIGAYTEAAVVMVLFVIGEALEGFAAGRARHSIRSLIAAAPNQAILLDFHEDHSHERTVSVDSLTIGDRILVKPGQTIPMDGSIVAGNSAVNQSPVTGESRLVEKVVGDEVFASSINGEGTLEIEVTHLAADNTISRLIRMVEEAQEKKAPTQRFVDRFAAVYTPIVVGVAAAVAVIPPIFLGQPFWETPSGHGWLYRGLALLVVACPCALVISTPVSLVSAISNAAKSGVIFKGGVFIELLSKARVIAFDKTGTLTRGLPELVGIQSTDCTNPGGDCEPCSDLLALASALESRSEHPIAHAVTHEARHRGLTSAYPAAVGVTALTGRGVTGLVNGDTVTIGSHPYFDKNIPHPTHCQEVARADNSGHTTMLISRGMEYLGYLTVSDAIRPGAPEAISDLKAMGIEEVVMLTGDNEATAHRVAETVGVTRYEANCLPENKVRAIESLREMFDSVAMVGDGINDTPALATADIGIAIGSSPQAMETADVTLMADNLSQLPFAVRLSRAAMRTIRFNVAVSIGIKAAFFLLVLAGFGTMWLAVLADMGTSLLVTLNGVRLLEKPSFTRADA